MEEGDTKLLKGGATLSFLILITLPFALPRMGKHELGYSQKVQEGSTLVSGYVSENTTWTLSNSPYIVEGDVIVEQDVFLTIEPGVFVKFAAQKNLLIDGSLICEGNSTHMIVFTSNSSTPAPGDLETIRFRGAYLTFEYCIVKYAVAGVLLESPADISNCLVSKCHIGLKTALRKVQNVTVTYCEAEGINTPGGATLNGCNICNNGGNGIYSGGGLEVTNSIISNNSGDGIHTGFGNISMSSITNNGGNGVWVYQGEKVNHNNIIGNQGFDLIFYKAGAVLDATYNWWGTTNETLIEKHIFDYYDNSNFGKVLYKPYLATRFESYPVASFIYDPSEPVLNETVAFNASASYDLEENIATYSWDFGDGENHTGTDPVATHSYTTPGTYYVTLTVTDSMGLSDNDTKWVNVGKLGSNISISASPIIITIGNNTTLSGSITPMRQNAFVTIWHRLADGTIWNMLANLTTDENSKYSYSWIPSEPGNYKLKANWTGDQYTLSAEASAIDLECAKIATSISISTSSSSTFVGFRVNVTGTLVDEYRNELSNETIVLYYAFGGIGTWTPITSSITNQLGHYDAQWSLPATGDFIIKAEWAGNLTHTRAVSDVTLNVLPYQDQYVFSVESNSTISDLTFDAQSRKLRFTATGMNGTTGYTKVTVAKSLVPDITNLKVRIDSTEYNYTVADLNDSWVLSFIYDHSTHSMEVDLDPNAIPEFSPVLILPVLMLATLAGMVYKEHRKAR